MQSNKEEAIGSKDEEIVPNKPEKKKKVAEIGKENNTEKFVMEKQR